MTARRPLLTAAAAGSVLFALWFVPSAHAIVGTDGATRSDLRAESVPADRSLTDSTSRTDRTSRGAGHDGTASTTTDADEAATDNGPGTSGVTTTGHLLADTGSPDTTPYVIGGAACLALGAGLVSYSVRRTRDETI